jgi:hypothetical protein
MRARRLAVALEGRALRQQRGRDSTGEGGSGQDEQKEIGTGAAGNAADGK